MMPFVWAITGWFLADIRRLPDLRCGCHDTGISMAHNQKEISEARRRFLARCGKYAIATPPSVGLLLSAAKRNYAVASSGHGWSGHHDHHTVGGSHHNGGWGGNLTHRGRR